MTMIPIKPMEREKLLRWARTPTVSEHRLEMKRFWVMEIVTGNSASYLIPVSGWDSWDAAKIAMKAHRKFKPDSSFAMTDVLRTFEAVNTKDSSED